MKKALKLVGVILLASIIGRFIGVISGFIARFFLDPKLSSIIEECHFGNINSCNYSALSNITAFFASGSYIFIWIVVGGIVGLFLALRFLNKPSSKKGTKNPTF